MLKIITTLTLFLIGMLAKGQTEQRNVTEFSKVEVAHGIELIYTESPVFSMQVETSNPTLLKNTITEVTGTTLRINLKKGTVIPTNETVKVYLSAYDITALEANSNAKITIENQLNATELDIVLKSGGSLKGNIKTNGKTKLLAKEGTVFNGRIEALAVKGNFKGNARINLTGKSESAVFHTSDVALLSARNFTATTISLNATGKSKSMIHADSKVAVNVADEAKVTYTGFPERIELNEEAETFNKYDPKQLVSMNN